MSAPYAGYVHVEVTLHVLVKWHITEKTVNAVLVLYYYFFTVTHAIQPADNLKRFAIDEIDSFLQVYIVASGDNVTR